MGSDGLREFLSDFLLVYINAGIFVALATFVVFYIPEGSQPKKCNRKAKKKEAFWEYWK